VDQSLALSWQLSEVHGWGLVGVHTALYLTEIGRPPLLLVPPALPSLRPENRAKLAALLPAHEQIAALAARHPGSLLRLGDCTMLHGLANGFVPDASSGQFRGDRNVGVIAFEDTRLSGDVLERARSFDKLVVHSTYNRQLLEAVGIDAVGCALQGVDPGELPLLAPRRRFGDRFVIFSGGKLEFRKGQDIVLAAFRRFHERHPEALLVTAWHNPWPHTAADVAQSPHVSGAPAAGSGRHLRLLEWAFAQGIRPGSIVDAGFLRREQIPEILAECHAAVFPNRCEGATNLVAMEAMACRVPVILSANTGHLDLIRPGNCLPLVEQTPVPDPEGARQGWGESSVDELVARLETLYSDRALAASCAEQASEFIRRDRTWRGFAQSFVEAVQ
jgi:glycosyltransferase involved in cell wall biosynthesis